MAHAIWHIDPSYIGRYWKDKLMGGALAAQEGVVDPLLDRLVGTAPGIPVRPFFGGETGVPSAQPTRPSVSTGPKSVADIVNNFKTPASIGFTLPPSTPVGAPPAAVPPAAVAPAAATPDGSFGYQSPAGAAQFRKDSMMDQRGPLRLPVSSANAAITTPATNTSAVQQMLRDQLIRLNSGRPAKPGDRPISPGPSAAATGSYAGPGQRGFTPPRVQAEAVTPERFRPQPQRTAREEAMHGRLTDPSIMQRPGVKEFLGEEEDDELGGMLKMMFMSDLIRGSAADTPSYPRAVSVGPASRDFARLPSMRWR